MKTSLVEREIMTLFAFLGMLIEYYYSTVLKSLDKKGDGSIYFDHFITCIRVRQVISSPKIIFPCQRAC